MYSLLNIEISQPILNHMLVSGFSITHVPLPQATYMGQNKGKRFLAITTDRLSDHAAGHFWHCWHQRCGVII